MKATAYINRSLLSVIVLGFLIGLLGNQEAIIYSLLGTIPFGAFQVIVSLILITFWDRLSRFLKNGLIIYYVVVPIYFLSFFILDAFYSGYLDSSFFLSLMIAIPIILAIGLTAIIESLYKSIK